MQSPTGNEKGPGVFRRKKGVVNHGNLVLDIATRNKCIATRNKKLVETISK